MQTHLSSEFIGAADAKEASALLNRCVHCGFCNATCPTYQVLGDELDGPRGRIYLIKQVLEGSDVTRSTQQHLDRCLTCLNCESTCPSGVEYGRLLEIGRQLVDARVDRQPADKVARWLLKEGLTSAWFGPLWRLGQALRPILPKRFRNKVPARAIALAPPKSFQADAPKVLLLQGCVQPSMLPNIDDAAVRVLDAAGIGVIRVGDTGCCGALRTHLGDHDGGLHDMRRNIDAWDPMLAKFNIFAVVSSASACALAIKNYGHALVHDSEYAEKAARVSALACDLSELLPRMQAALKPRIRLKSIRRVAFHPPCTLQHGQRLRGGVEAALRGLGLQVDVARSDSHLCCGSAGAYSILQPQIALELRDRKLQQLSLLEPQYILSANVGCIHHLQSGTATPVKHWIEWLDEVLVAN